MKLVLIESHDKEFQELFSADLDEREYDRYPVQCGAGIRAVLVDWSGRIVLCHNARPGDLETSRCRLPSEPLSIVLTSNISYVFMDRGSSGTTWVLPRQCFTLDVVTESQGSLILIIEPFPW